MQKRLAPSVVAVLALAGVARADGTLTINFELQADDDLDGDFDALSDMQKDEHFNRSRCLCASPVRWELTSPNADTHQAAPVQVWIGSGCNVPDLEMRDQTCDQLALGFDVSALRTVHFLALTVNQAILGGTCDPIEKDPETLWLLVDENNDMMFEHEAQYPYLVDFQPPTLPSPPVAKGVEDGFTVEWSLNEADDDVLGFQVLCAQSDGTPVFPSPPSALYELAQQRCGVVDPEAGLGGGTPPAADAGVDPDGGVIDAAPAPDAPAASGGVANLDRRFVCSGTISSTSTSARIAVPANVAAGGIDVYLAVVDRHKNAKLYLAGRGITAEPVTDFWEAYAHEGGEAKGGFCAVTPVGSRAGLGLGAAALMGLLLALRRRRRTTAAGLALALLALAPAAASAQVMLDEDVEEDAWHTPLSAWVFELKFGPYYPQVDEESGLRSKPFETTFGAKENFLTQVELDRFFLWPFGQLGVGVSAGYLQDTARSFTEDDAGNPNITPDPSMRADDKTRFRLIPTSVVAVYRLTALADRTPVPLVPYAKVGVAYYLWWITKGDGSVTSTPGNGKARGATLGWQGTIGLALRADFLDPQASRNLSIDYGIEHACFFAEFTHADVDGLGAGEKLHVGDDTWAAGVNFEF